MSKLLNSWIAHSSERLAPYQATLELTYRCNERCGHCYLATYDDDDAEDGRPPLRLDEWKRILGELADAGSLHLILMGGEAMLHPDFWSIAEHAADFGFSLGLITNGLMIDDPAADRLAALGFQVVSVSLYSMNPEVHDAMTRRKGSHWRTRTAIERLRARGVAVNVNCLLTSANIDTCWEVFDWAETLGAKALFDPLVTPKMDGSLETTATRARPEQLRRYFSEAQKRERGPQPMPGDDPESPVCNQGRGKCAVNVRGDLLTCLEVRDPIGNLRDSDFNTLWHSSKAQRLRSPKVSDLKFDPTCGDGAFCDHCPGIASTETGDPLSPVPFLMELARIKREVHAGTQNPTITPPPKTNPE